MPIFDYNNRLNIKINLAVIYLTLKYICTLENLVLYITLAIQSTKYNIIDSL